MKYQTPVAITGMGCLSAAGRNLMENMASLCTGKRRAAPPTRFSSSHTTTYPVFETFENTSISFSQKNKAISRTSRLGLYAALEAIEDAGWTPRKLATKRTGVCMGTTVGSAMNNEEFYIKYRQGQNPDLEVIDKYLRSNPAAVIAREFGLSGPCQTIVNACSSGTDAIGVGASWIRSGICDVVIAGGADELCRVTYNGFISLMITDDEVCKPFDKNRKGLNLGEGAAILLLESEDTVRERKKAPRSFVLGYGSASDAYHLTAPRPDGCGLKQALHDAMAESHTAIEDIAFVNAHGTATPDNDRVEGRVLRELLPGVPFLSTKGFTGHTLGAAGAIEAAFTVACLEARRIPSSAGFTTMDPELGVSPANQSMALNRLAAISESLAFGGHNSALVLGLSNREEERTIRENLN
ncbi:MAG: beta-ketoacyl-[acyl-carrier-protein] synthase family protein [Proteobacteria bacterium]|nr:beta-ketoacyl-[acyl-carrier-protein] synthase family protein [Pseudomonadota bacterium]MBU4472081.1 beta-ketoacyl-[acyl-carrier-protein] synthase family protein [Pseudomonadota bacterium]MCG2752920.1 beta-ketoacyl-[acyl-carrier-protein] synthase family protein [Desulfobacteraceae bacterium]